jgi:hypothetical protein
MVDESKILRGFAAKYIYSKEKYSDFFLTGILGIINSVAGISFVFYTQLTMGYLPWWVIYAYYFSWVGIGGRMMGTAYSYAHKEGHNKTQYQSHIRRTIGNIYENWLGLFFGNVPHNFSTSHVMIHHRLNAGKGDTVYQWDMDRTSIRDQMLFQHRFMTYMSGFTNLKYFADRGMTAYYKQLLKGVVIFWVVTPMVEYAITRSLAFVFWIHIQPLICMAFFLAFINTGFHGFLHFDGDTNVWCVNSSTIIDGDDDYYGEDDHMLHHYATSVYHTDLKAHRETKMDELKKYHASVFKEFSIMELSAFIIFSQWDKLADHYVDLAGDLSRDQIKAMLKERAQRKECNFEEYCEWRTQQAAEGREKSSV